MSELCLKDEVVLKLKDNGSEPVEVLQIVNGDLLPVCLQNNCTTETFLKWLHDRQIPKNREGLNEVTEKFGHDWLDKNINYISLSDHYWIKKRQEKWKNVNFFTNRYPTEIGDMFFLPWEVTATRFKATPDLTCGGVLKKCWRQNADLSSYLLKAGSVVARQEPLSEVLVSVLCEKLKIVDCVRYDLHVEGTTMCSRCDNFVTITTDFVPASEIFFSEPRPKNRSVYHHLMKMCEKYNIPNAEEHIKAVLAIDKLTGNKDRNLKNLGFKRDVKSLKFLGPAPLFDSGNAYWNTKNVNNDEEKNQFFGDVENQIFEEVKKKYDLFTAFEDRDYEAVIAKYPNITDQKKENLITEISKQAKRLQSSRSSIER